ncbi:hypothetical protein [Halomonas sp. LC1]|jgi:regulator of replication initiation timing|uniref:hypothetical protein n=1 Tax=Halomonas sp. LC1 TaxID=3043733 RepID=UPI0025553124|nr:hypothetical protein [Halomonas sp. LC1]MDK9686406.1 hypothetical protein [Halomonas sp. LC1]
MTKEYETPKKSAPSESKLDARGQIISKIEVIEEYCETKQARFELPRRGAFSLNWFTDFAGIHKTNRLIKKDGEFRPRLDQALKDAIQVYKAIAKFDPAKETEVEQLKRENTELEATLRRLATDVWDLMKENEEFRRRLGVAQAQHRDKAKVARLKEGGD